MGDENGNGYGVGLSGESYDDGDGPCAVDTEDSCDTGYAEEGGNGFGQGGSPWLYLYGFGAGHVY